MKILDAGRTDPEKLIGYGFTKSGEAFTLERPVEGGMTLRIIIENSVISAGIFDGGEEYTLIFTDAPGEFVGRIRGIFESEMSDLTARCFERRLFSESFSGRQTRLVIDYSKENFDELPEFLWKDTPDCAILRNKSSGKWYAVLMRVKLSKFFPGAEGECEVVNLRADATALSDGKSVFPAFHMNKKSWISVLCDYGTDDGKLLGLLSESRGKSAKKERRKRQ